MSVSIPVVAFVGRPNVGKSTLFNCLMRRRAALVMDFPGVTRDRIIADAEIDGRVLRLVDTGGLEIGSDDVFFGPMARQTELAIDEADLVVLVLDGRDGVRPDDAEIARMVRRAGKPCVAVVNKLDMDNHEDFVNDFYQLGLHPLLGLSAEHRRGIGDLKSCILDRVNGPLVEEMETGRGAIAVREDEPEEGVADRVEWDGGPIRVAVVGRPNVGKSSLVNRLLGEQRLLASEVAGTTRDAIDVDLRDGEQDFVLVDTAGMRRRRAVIDRLEHYSVLSAVRSIEKADIVLVLFDSTDPLTEQDLKIASLAEERGKGIIFVGNKRDLLKGDDADLCRERIKLRLPGGLAYVPILQLSAKTGRGIKRLLPTIVAAQKERHRRIATSELNRFIRAAVTNHPPASRKRRRPKIYYVTQPFVSPPTFILMVNYVDAIQGSYERYLENALRQAYGFAASPLWLKWRQKDAKKRSQ